MNEKWRDINGYEGMYAVSSFGRVKSLSRIIERTRGGKLNHLPMQEKIMKTMSGLFPYPRVSLCKDGKKRMFLVHILVMRCFVGEKPTNMDVNHLDGVKTNNNLKNLEYCTRSQNIKHAYDTNLRTPPTGERNVKAKITEKEAIEIYNSKEPTKDAMKKFGVSYQIHYRIKTRKQWKHIHN